MKYVLFTPTKKASLIILVVQWKVFVLDHGSKRILDGVVREDDILEANITSVSYHLSLEYGEG